MKDKLKLASDLKKTIVFLDKLVVNFPNTEKVLKDKIMDTAYDILELIYVANVDETDRIKNQKIIVSKLKMIDFYAKRSYDKKYISYKKYNTLCSILENNIKCLYGWIKYEKDKKLV